MAGPTAAAVACLAAWQRNATPGLLTFVDDELGCGLGCRFLRMAAAMLAALDAGRVLALSPASRWSYAAGCGARGHDCYFAAAAPRAGGVALSLGARRHAHPDQWTAPGAPLPAAAVFTRGSLDGFWAAYRRKRGRRVAHPCLAGLADPCTQTAAVAAFLLRPNARLAAAIPRLPARPYAAMHVRHGDKGRERRGPEVGLAAYVDRLTSAFPRTRNVWLVTEDPAVVAATATFANLTFYYTAFNRTNAPERGLPAPAIRAVAENALANLFVASRADAFVGTAASWTSRIALLAIIGESGSVPPFAMVDRPLKQVWFA